MKRILYRIISAAASLSLLLPHADVCAAGVEDVEKDTSGGYIKYIDFDVTAAAMSDAAGVDIETRGSDVHIDWISALSLLAVKYGGDFSRYKRSDLDAVCGRLSSGETAFDITPNEKLYKYYLEAYGAVLGGMLGEYVRTEYSDGGAVSVTDGYGVRAFSPIAAGFWYNDYDDFGAARSFGYRRPHLGHDMMGSVGTPIIAVESCYIEALGWNVYGGWRCGIRSFDGKRYYYYAHLRRGHPYADLYEGKTVMAGEVIGYLGMTGYSTREDKNNIDTPHLHVGLEVIFDPSQKDGYNQIWIDMDELCKFLSDNRAPTARDGVSGETVSRVYLTYPESPD